MRSMRFTLLTGALAAVVGLTACDDLLTVSDPQRYTDADLNSALQAVANGVEGAVHEVIDTYVVYQELLADTYQHTGTWQGYDEVDHGIFQYGTSAMDGTMNSLLRARWFAASAEERFAENGGTPSMVAQVHLGAAMADLYLGQAFCEAPAVPSGPAVSDQVILQQAVTEFTRAISSASASGDEDYELAAIGGRARAKLLLGDYAGAAADAAQVPDGFSYDAKFNNSSSNWVVTVTTATFNKAAGLREKWWGLIDNAGGPTYMRDPWTLEFDERIPVYFNGGIATDNITPHYSQWKYDLETDDIPMIHSDEMRLIEAEYLMRQGDLVGFIGIVNDLRDAVGLSILDTPVDSDEAMDILLSERFAETFMEGQRASDLWRLGLTRQIFEDMDDVERDPIGRPIKFPMSSGEALYNDNIENLLTSRCLPKTS